MSRTRRIQVALVGVVIALGLVLGLTALTGDDEPEDVGGYGGTTFPLEPNGLFLLGHDVRNPDGRKVTILDVRAATSPNVRFSGIVLGQEQLGGGGSSDSLPKGATVLPLPQDLPPSSSERGQIFATVWQIESGRGGLDDIVVTYRVGSKTLRDLHRYGVLMCVKPLKSCEVPGLESHQDELAEVGVPNRH